MTQKKAVKAVMRSIILNYLLKFWALRNSHTSIKKQRDSCTMVTEKHYVDPEIWSCHWKFEIVFGRKMSKDSLICMVYNPNRGFCIHLNYKEKYMHAFLIPTMKFTCTKVKLFSLVNFRHLDNTG